MMVGGCRIGCGSGSLACCRRRRFTRWGVTRRGCRIVTRWTRSCWCCAPGCSGTRSTRPGVCSSSSAHRRFQEWEQAGVFARDLAPGSVGVRRGGRDRLVVSGGGRRDDQGAFGRTEDGPEPYGPGQKGAKRSVLTDAAGVPVGVDHDGANRNDHKLLKGTLDSIPIERPAADPRTAAGPVPGQGL